VCASSAARSSNLSSARVPNSRSTYHGRNCLRVCPNRRRKSANRTRSRHIASEPHQIWMRNYSVGDVDGEVIGRIACASLRHEYEVPGPVIGRAGVRDGSQGKTACDHCGKQELLHHRFSEALAVLAMSPWSVLHLQIHQLGMCHHILIQVGHDHERPREDQEYYEHAKGERQEGGTSVWTAGSQPKFGSAPVVCTENLNSDIVVWRHRENACARNRRPNALVKCSACLPGRRKSQPQCQRQARKRDWAAGKDTNPAAKGPDAGQHEYLRGMGAATDERWRQRGGSDSGLNKPWLREGIPTLPRS
jgi:hypothetical protein